MSQLRTAPKNLEGPLVGLVLLLVAAIVFDCMRAIQEHSLDSHPSEPGVQGGCVYQIIEDGGVVRTDLSAQSRNLSEILSTTGLSKKFNWADGSQRMPCDRVIKFNSTSQSFITERVPGALLVAASRRIDVNVADESDLRAVPGIGPRTAEKIVRYRDQAGSFSCLDDLLRIPGIGKKKLAGFASYLEIKGSDCVQGIQNLDGR